MYKIKPCVIDGEIINDLLNLCNEHFSNTMIQEYAGANLTCLYCGANGGRNTKTIHSEDCPKIKYNDIINKHTIFFKEVT